ncbi:MAG: hypothetical protein Q8Q14_10690 [Gemmatimonadales bacterium]|nr:hypothetical protein [Gemmatimonadales bacterium]
MKSVTNPTEEEKASSINVKQVMLIGAITALTGTVVGALSMELYRYLRPKIPIPPPSPYPMLPPQQAQTVQNPGYTWPTPMQPQQPQYAVQQIGAFPSPQSFPQQNPYPPMAALPPVQSAVPALPVAEPEPLSRGELARWQRGLEGWQRELERRDSNDRRDPNG